MSEVSQYSIITIDSSIASPFVKKWHYSKSCPGGKVYFGLIRNGELIGVSVFGEPAMMNQSDCYQCDIELRRLCLIDETPKNAESRFIGLCLRKLRKMGFISVLSLADPEHGHTGTIYKASNFEYLGEEIGGGSRLIVIDGIEIHSRSAFAKYGISGIKGLQTMLGESRVSGRNKKRKHVYRYVLNRSLTKQ